MTSREKVAVSLPSDLLAAAREAVARGEAPSTGASASQVTMAWLRARSERAATAQVPIIGPRSLTQLQDYLASLDIQLSVEQIDGSTG